MNHPHLMALGIALSAALLTGCDDKAEPAEEDSAAPEVRDSADPNLQDNDGDGWSEANGDCDDADPDVYPGQTEDCDGIDNNCNGVVDETFGDSDNDGTADCVDTEECDGLDNDGDGEIDEDWSDSDGDGVADCPDDDDEICDGLDNDGDGEIDEGFDNDGDGYSGCDPDGMGAEDCDDDNADVNPGAAEVDDDLIDNNCDGLIDEGEWAAGDLVITEVMNNPAAVNDPDGEWFEVWNSTDRTIALNGLILTSTVDGDWHQVTSQSPVLVEPGEYAVLGTNDDLMTNGYVEVDYVYDHAAFSLSNEFDAIVLEADSVVVDGVEWDDGATFPDPAGASQSLDPGYVDATLNDSGDYWCNGKTFWSSEAVSDLGTPGVENPFCWPVADASYDASSTLYSCDELQLLGSGSTDSGGLPLTYEWELTSAPAGSMLDSSDIDTTTDADPTFNPDEPGVYVFTLTVFNGEEYSQPSSVAVTITERPTNTDPVANAGEDDSYDETIDCTPISYGVSYDCDDCSDYDFQLDGTSSYDPDGDWFGEPSWSIVSGSSSASITDEDTWEPTVTVSGGAATYGATNSTTVEVELTVVDCMGATATDTVTLTYECTGG